MANVDTPGYHARDINFEQELQKAMKQSDSGLSTAGYIARQRLKRMD